MLIVIIQTSGVLSSTTKIQKFKNSKIQKFKNSKIQKFKNSKIQKFNFKNSKIGKKGRKEEGKGK